MLFRSFDLLNTITPERILRTAKTAALLPHFSWRDLVPGDHVLQVGESAVSTNEKYLRLIGDALCDDCLTRTAIRNLRLFAHGMRKEVDLSKLFGSEIAPIPTGILDRFLERDTRGEFKQEIRPLSFD